jgi:hypothetical protein
MKINEPATLNCRPEEPAHSRTGELLSPAPRPAASRQDSNLQACVAGASSIRRHRSCGLAPHRRRPDGISAQIKYP